MPEVLRGSTARGARGRIVAGGALRPLLMCVGPRRAHAEELAWASGTVLDPQGRAMRGAYVAVYDDSNKVVDYARTDSKGEYALAVPKHLLHLTSRHG